MKREKTAGKYGLTRKTGIFILLQMILMAMALMISLLGVFRSLDLVNQWSRLIVYGGQAAICLATIVFGICFFGKKNVFYFKGLVMAYALLEAIRVSLLRTGGVAERYSFLAKFILVLLAVCAALLCARLEQRKGLYLSLSMVGLEIFLYVIFLIGFPAVRTRLLYMIVPLVGILMAGSMCIFVSGRLEQVACEKRESNT